MTIKHGSRLRHAITIASGIPLTVGLLAACQLSTKSEGAAYAEDCPNDSKLATSVHLDVSGSFITDKLDGQRLAVVRDSIGRTAACGGHLRVSAFAGSSAGTAVLFDDDLHLKGSTETARLRRIPALIDELTQQIEDGYNSLPEMTGGTDVVGQLRGDQEYVAQLGEGYSLWSITATDGLQTAGVQWRKLIDARTAEAEASALQLADSSRAQTAGSCSSSLANTGTSFRSRNISTYSRNRSRYSLINIQAKSECVVIFAISLAIPSIFS